MSIKAVISLTDTYKAKMDKVIAINAESVSDLIIQLALEVSNNTDATKQYYLLAVHSADSAVASEHNAANSEISALNSKNYALISEANALSSENKSKAYQANALSASETALRYAKLAEDYAKSIQPENIALLTGKWGTTLANEILESRLLGYTATDADSNLIAVLNGEPCKHQNFAIPIARANAELERRLNGFVVGDANTNLEVILHGK